MKLGRLYRSALTIALAGMLSILTVLPGQAANTVTVTAGNMQGWLFYNDETDQVNNALGSFVTGPGTAPLGVGSAQISVTGTQRRNLATYQFAGTVLSTINTLKYSTYNPSAGNGGSANNAGYLQFNVDFNGTDTWQRRLVFVPKDNGTVVQNSWQEWSASTSGALWRYSGPTWPGTVISGTTPRTWSEILSSYPGVRIRVTDAFLGIRVGEPYPAGYTENIDVFKFGAGSQSVEFNFEPTIGPPTDKDQCKKGGWKQFNTPTYKNQGGCVSSVASGH